MENQRVSKMSMGVLSEAKGTVGMPDVIRLGEGQDVGIVSECGPLQSAGVTRVSASDKETD